MTDATTCDPLFMEEVWRDQAAGVAWIVAISSRRHAAEWLKYGRLLEPPITAIEAARRAREIAVSGRPLVDEEGNSIRVRLSAESAPDLDFVVAPVSLALITDNVGAARRSWIN